MESESALENLKRSRIQFGQMLKRWRKRQGWSGRTWEDWAAACPEVLPIPLVNSVVTGLELCKNERTIPSTFLALGIANQALAKPDRGVIRERILRDRVYGATPITHEDGSAWDGADFFAAFTGFISPPAELMTEPPPPETAILRERFQKLRTEGGLSPRAALDYLLSLQPRHPRQTRDRVEEVLFGFAEFGPDEAETATLVDLLLSRWEKP